MRRAALILAALSVLIAGCGTSQHAHLWLSVPHRFGDYECVSTDCGPWTATLNFQIPAYPGQTGYWLFLNGVKVGSASSTPFTFRGWDCGVTDTLGVEAHDSAGNHGPLWTMSHTSASCVTFTCPAGVRCFYVSTSGSDSNSGTSELSPWAHAPGMPTFTGTYTHQAGDEFIFEGGDTWGNASFPLTAKGSGNASHDDYYGVDPSWYAGASFTQPTFDAQSQNIESGTQDTFLNLQGHDYIEVDDIKFANWTASSITGGYGTCAVVNLNGDQHVTINRIDVTGMAIDSSGDAQNASCAVAFGDTAAPYGGSDVLENSTITGGGSTYGIGAWSIANVENNTISGIPNMIYPSVPANGTGQISGNLLSGCGSPSFPSGASNVHGDMILVDITGNPSTLYIHDNVLHDTGASGTNECESMWFGNNGETDYVYNNVLYNLNGTGPMKVGNNNTNTSAGTAYIWDNSLTGASNGSTGCITGYSTSYPSVAVTVQDNLCVSSNATSIGPFYCSGGGQACVTTDHNLTLTPSQESSDVTSGLLSSSPFQYAPTSTSSPTVGIGTSLTADCAGALASLCSDTTYAGARSTVTRPGANGWDVGAYQER